MRYLDIKLIDIDSKIPNLALMQISAYHKSQGDNVGFNIRDPDKVYISCIFKKNRGNTIGVKTFFPDAEVVIGGSGVNYNWLPEEMQKIKPDYDLYQSNYSLGFTTRGCIRHCGFCIVRDKEGGFQRWQHIREFHDPRFDNVVCLDNNAFADKDWFMENTDFILENDLHIEFTQGLDVRLLDKEFADRLKELKSKKTIKFAFDSIHDEKAVRRGISTLKEAGVNVRGDVQFYVLVGYNTSPDEDKYRCRLLKELGTNAFVMPYAKTKWTRRIARWANRKWVFWSCDIDEFGVGK